MRWTRKISLRRKLMLVIMTNTVVALCVAGIAYAEYGVQRFKQVGMQDLNALAKILGTNCTAPLIFKDPNSAREILQALTVKPHIVAAAIYDHDGKSFVVYKANASRVPDFPPLLQGEASRFTSDLVVIYQPIYFDGEKIGAVLLEGDRGEERELLLRYLYFFGLIILVVSLGAYVMAGQLQSPISNPILELAWTTKMVTSSRDYSIRAGKRSDDEVGVLIDGFNEMLEQIQNRDTELRLAREDLERRVDERTTELEQEVADRQRAQEALRESEGKIRLLLDSAAEAIFGIDREGRFSFCNPATLRMLGYEDGQALLGKSAHEVMHHSRADGSRYPIEECPIVQSRMKGAGIHLDSEVFWRSDGTSFPAEYWAYPIRKEGEIVGAVITFLDITVRKRAQAALLEAKEAAEAGSRSKSEFLANMSHEIRTPMNGIIGMTELALDTTLTGEQREYLNLAKSSADSLLHIIDDILDFSKIEAGKLELEKTEFKIRDLFKDTLRTLAVRADKKGTEVSLRVSPDVPVAVVGDPTRLRQLLVNLVGNSIKFTVGGNIHVNTDREPGGESEIRLRISVSDTGIGIPHEKQQVIFEPFSQADGSTTRRFGGTGLGLTISRQLVELMGGRMWLESEVGKGSAFYFTCAFEKGMESDSGEEKAAGLIPAGLNVLIVDNSPTNHLILGEMLANWRMNATMASSGSEAMSALEKARNSGRPFSIVLLDARMPDIDGLQILERIHGNPGMASAVIMMLSIERQKSDAARCRELGVDQILNKPISQSELLDAILSVLGLKVAGKQFVEMSSPAPANPSAHSLNILLAEDNLVNQKLAIRLLEKAGHRVTLANTGREAFEASERQEAPEFDVVLMDIQMPEMDGMEATAAIRGRERKSGKHVPILAMTAHAMRGDREKCLASGMDGYISKPIHPAALFAEIDRCLTRHEGSKEMVDQSGPSGEQVDRASLLERVEGDEELLVEMVNLFQQDAPNLLAAIRDSLQAGDMTVLERSAHSLKGAAGNLSAKAAAAAASQLEKDAKNKATAAAKTSFVEVERALKNLLPALAELCEAVTK
jgi:two-component system, sensor histidine kinase and response regulator